MALPGFTNVSTASDLSADIKAIDLDSQGGAGGGTVYTITLMAGATLTETTDLDAINLKGNDTLTIVGSGAKLDGGGAYQGFFVYQGIVAIQNLTIQNTLAVGGAAFGGGAGAGLGGGLFVANDAADNALPSAVTLNNVAFLGDTAKGGKGNTTYSEMSGGGGLGGVAHDTGGGSGNGNLADPGQPGIIIGAASGGGSGGGASGGGGGANAGGGVGGAPGSSSSLGITGGNGGFGGGAGAGTFGGFGGFGGGGGDGSKQGGNGGFGGGGGAGGGHGGFGGGDGGDNTGGGGLGAGGAVFVQAGASLTVTGGSVSGGSAIAGVGADDATYGLGLGSGIFIQGNQSVTFGTGQTAGQVTEVDDVIADENGATGDNNRGRLVVDGAGTVLLKGLNTYTGGTTIKGGTLDLEGIGPGNGAGDAGIQFSPGAVATLRLGPAAFTTPGSMGIYNYGVTAFAGDTIDVGGLTYVAGQTTATLSNNVLTITNGTATDQVRFVAPANTTFVTSDDGLRGTDVTLLCFAAGTLIRTARGRAMQDVAVEALRIGDLAVTASGALRPITWIGSRTIDCTAAAVQSGSWPVRISAGAFGDLPERDLYLSPGHPVLVDDHLVPIMCLINGTSIARVPVASVTYWHVELDAHDILLAEGLPAESFLDFGTRSWFDEGVDHALANPDFIVPGLGARCRPVALDGPVVERARRRLDGVFVLRLAAAAYWPSLEDCVLPAV